MGGSSQLITTMLKSHVIVHGNKPDVNSARGQPASQNVHPYLEVHG